MLRATKGESEAAATAAAEGTLRRVAFDYAVKVVNLLQDTSKRRTRRGTHAHHLTVAVMIISSCCHNKVQAAAATGLISIVACVLRVDWLVFPSPPLPPLRFGFFMTRRCCLCRFNVNFSHFILRKTDKDRTTTAAAAAWAEHFHLPLARRFSSNSNCNSSAVAVAFTVAAASGHLTRLWSHWSGRKNNERNSKRNWSNSAAHQPHIDGFLTTFNCCGIQQHLRQSTRTIRQISSLFFLSII